MHVLFSIWCPHSLVFVSFLLSLYAKKATVKQPLSMRSDASSTPWLHDAGAILFACTNHVLLVRYFVFVVSRFFLVMLKFFRKSFAVGYRPQSLSPELTLDT